MTPHRWVSLLVMIVVAIGSVALVAQPEPLEQPPAATVTASVAVPAARYRTETREVSNGDTAGKLLRAMNGPADLLLAGAGTTLNRLRPGDRIHLDWRAGEAQPFRLRLDGTGTVRPELVWNGSRYVSRQVPIPYTVEEQAVAVTVHSSLWAAATRAGFSASQIMSLATIFEYDVDFNTELQAGARFRMVVDRLIDDAGAVRVGDVRAAILENGGKEYVALRHRAADGTLSWYDATGAARKKAFLRSPLEFSRVTSGFSLGRYHPILHKMRAHKGVDFAAPTGTPVRSVADGVVTRAGWAGGHGNQVEVKHEGGYTTGFSHLSKMHVKVGERVRQGQIVGRVGSTGMSTGPHLHYEFRVNGVHRDPLKAIVPVARPLEEAERPAFFAFRDLVVPMLASATEVGDPAADPPEPELPADVVVEEEPEAGVVPVE